MTAKVCLGPCASRFVVDFTKNNHLGERLVRRVALSVLDFIVFHVGRVCISDLYRLNQIT